ncbi:FKBP-type peptidyl-prolyl cis-trans isomerase [Candidatus Latescibacterota bacterium]
MQHSSRIKIAIALIIILSLSTFACGEKNGGSVDLSTDIAKVSYTIGIQLGQNFKQQNMEIDADIMSSAIKDVLNNNVPLLTDEEMAATMQELNNRMMAKQQEAAANNLVEAEAFIAENAKKSSVITLDGNLQYEVITDGTGAIPKTTDTVSVHYHGTLMDGTVFDSSVERGEPVQFAVTGVIPGWTQILQLMKTGSKWKVYIPPALAYGQQGNQVIQPNTLLIFEIELLDIVTAQ